MHGALVISGIRKVRQMEYLDKLRFQPLVENRDPYQDALEQKKGRQSERIPNSERAAKGTRIAWSLLLMRKDR